MYTSYIGKKFLSLYNRKEGANFSAKEFFDSIFFELFFNNERHLMHVHGSSFFQTIDKVKAEASGGIPLAKLKRLHNDIKTRKISGSTYVGYAAGEISSVTSGQVSSINNEITDTEMYASWIGEALGIGVSGGYVMLIDEEDVLWALYNGWKYYRKYLQQTPNVKDKQIETWNGQWLWHWVRPYFSPKTPDDNLNIETTDVQGNIAIPTQQWSKVIFALAKKYPNKKITTYAYNLSQTNTTLGFINLYLPQVNKVFDFRDKLFAGEDTVLKEEELETLSTFYNFKQACKLGTIGLKALEPAKLREYMPKGSILYAQGKEYKFNNNETFANYQLFKIWIVAMLNKTELLALATSVANALIDFEKMDERGKKVYSTLSQEIRESNNLKGFIDKLAQVLGYNSVHADSFKEVVEQVLKMPTDNFPLFITLIRFEYSYMKSKSNS